MMRNTEQHIVATIGPASENTKTLSLMLESGMTMARLNMSHGTHNAHEAYITTIRSLRAPVPIIMDLSGPRKEVGAAGHAFDPGQPALTTKDIHDVAFGVRNKVDWIALSYPKSAEDILMLKKELQKMDSVSTKIMTKIERKEAVNNIDALIEASDAILIGRGDLGNALGLKHLPKAVFNIISACRKRKSPVFVATEILESMRNKEHGKPTRAEATDAWLHGYTGSTGIVLSAETAIGEQPEKTIQWAKELFTQGREDRTLTPGFVSSDQ